MKVQQHGGDNAVPPIDKLLLDQCNHLVICWEELNGGTIKLQLERLRCFTHQLLKDTGPLLSHVQNYHQSLSYIDQEAFLEHGHLAEGRQVVRILRLRNGFGMRPFVEHFLGKLRRLRVVQCTVVRLHGIRLSVTPYFNELEHVA